MADRKRVNIILDKFHTSRGYVVIENNVFQQLEHNGEVYRSAEDFYHATGYETLVVSDRHTINCLRFAGFEVRGMVKNRESLHVSVSTWLLDEVKNEASYRNMTVSSLIEEMLQERYK